MWSQVCLFSRLYRSTTTAGELLAAAAGVDERERASEGEWFVCWYLSVCVCAVCRERERIVAVVPAWPRRDRGPAPSCPTARCSSLQLGDGRSVSASERERERERFRTAPRPPSPLSHHTSSRPLHPLACLSLSLSSRGRVNVVYTDLPYLVVQGGTWDGGCGSLTYPNPPLHPLPTLPLSHTLSPLLVSLSLSLSLSLHASMSHTYGACPGISYRSQLVGIHEYIN